jgi:nicotinamide-nucleotide amidase
MLGAGPHAIILTVGDEITSGEVENTNGSWLAQRLAELGLPVRMLAAVRDDADEIAAFVRERRDRCDVLVVTGGLGGTPDDVTREGVARAFEMRLVEDQQAAAELRRTFPERLHEYVTRFALLPEGARPIRNPLGGAPGFAVDAVYVLAGVPAEMRATFGEASPEIADHALGGPIRTVRLRYSTTEADIVAVLERAATHHPRVALGSYPSFDAGDRRVDIVLRSSDTVALEDAARWLSDAMDEVLAP